MLAKEARRQAWQEGETMMDQWGVLFKCWVCKNDGGHGTKDSNASNSPPTSSTLPRWRVGKEIVWARI